MDFIDYIKHKLSGTLPGRQGHLNMAPLIGGQPYRTFTPPSGVKNSAVLLLIIGNDENAKVLFTLRSTNISHSGQISFPGGRIEKDESDIDAALREAQEETGLPSESVEIIGRLSSLYVPPSNSLISPIVGNMDKLPELVGNQGEVQEIFTVPLAQFLSPDRIVREYWDFDGQKVLVPWWRVHHSTPLWGATAMIMNEILELIDMDEWKKHE